MTFIFKNCFKNINSFQIKMNILDCNDIVFNENSIDII